MHASISTVKLDFLPLEIMSAGPLILSLCQASGSGRQMSNSPVLFGAHGSPSETSKMSIQRLECTILELTQGK